MNKSLLSAAAAIALGVGVAQSAFAQAKPEILVKQRQAKMILQGKYFGTLVAVAQGKIAYDAALVQRSAGFLDNLTRMAWDGYDPSTRNEKSRTLAAVYDNNAKFREYASQLEHQTSRLVTLSKGGDEAAVKAQIGAIGKTCGGCHDDFRQKQ